MSYTPEELAAEAINVNRLTKELKQTHDDNWTAPIVDALNSLVRENRSRFLGECKDGPEALNLIRDMHGQFNDLRAEVERLRTEIIKLRAALLKIAKFDDEFAVSSLAQTGSYAGFDEPYSVEIARKALAESEAKA